MSRGRMTITLMLAAVTIIAAVFISVFSARTADINAPEIVLPPEVSDNLSPGSNPGSEVTPAPEPVEITTENVLDLIAALERPVQYSAGYRVERFWENSGQTLLIDIWVLDGCQRIRICAEDGQPLEHYITNGDTTYLWNEGMAQYYKGATGEFSSDDNAQLPTYESIAEKGMEIIRCGYEPLESTPCMFVETANEKLGITEKWWVSLDTGLLFAAQTWENGVLILDRTCREVLTGVVDRTRFLLPDGNSVFDIN